MASQSAIAEGSNIVTADQINYQQKLFSHPQYRYEPQFNNTFGQPIVLGSSQTPVTINVPPEVFNLSQSYLLYSVNIPPALGGVSYIWYALNALREISHIQFYAGSSMWMVDIDNLQNYLDILLKKEMDRDEFLSMTSETGVNASNSVVNVIPALRNANNLTTNAVLTLGPNPSSINYTEPGYFARGGLGLGVSYNVQFPLRLIKNSLFSVDKSVYFGQTTYLKVYFGPTSKICYSSDSPNSPSNGTLASYLPIANANPSIGAASGAAAAYVNSISPVNFQLLLAVETNQDLRTMLINKVQTEGLSYLIPYIQAFKNPNQGTSQNISIQLDQGNGRSLQKVYHAIYNAHEDMDTMYDHANTPINAASAVVTDAPGNPINQKVVQYYTQLNGQRIQSLTLDCFFTGPFTDYMSHRKQLRGSILSNINVYQYNWFHCDDWSDFGPKYDQDNKGELIAGIPMSVAPLTWSFVGVQMRLLNNTFNHYTWFVFVKKLTMSPGTVIVQ